MSLPMDRSVELFTLPNEIISQIFSLPILRRRDLAALRLSSKHINASASRDFGKRYFEFVHFTIFKQSLVALRDICQHPLLGPWVRHIRSFAQKPVDIKATLLGSIEYTDRVLQSVRFQSLRRVMLMRIQCSYGALIGLFSASAGSLRSLHLRHIALRRESWKVLLHWIRNNLSLSRLTLGGLHTINEAAIGEARCLVRERNMGGFHTGIGREHILSCIDRILEGSQLRISRRSHLIKGLVRTS